ncbi:hypothetical protein N7532_007465 [Penicillium argentinense]|uniref:Serine/arginine repetitive matrix protein 1 n=1 Tax=Penicillium argentinense TaxID=1131581 RepID=A0A9W9K6S0_9EURO|nr:uncharacterized protein N7532_007465 [Penicillium argentinense]KAJ5095174.1 hypothetical protein N7532_007465 [Penicillium argentinense]
MSTTSRSQSPSRAHRGEHPADTGKDRLPSRSRQASPTHVPVVESNATSRRSSPSNHPERGGPPPFRSRSRSPANQLPYHRPSGPPRRSPYRDQVYQSVTTDFGKAQETSDRFPRKEPSENSMSGPSRFGRNIPTQPRNLGVSQSPPLGPSQGPRGAPPQSRGSHNASILSAPTRPRHGPSSRDGSWMGAPMSARRAPPTMPSHGAPSGPRASLTPSTPLAPGTGYRHPGTRQNSSVSAISSPAPRNPNFLAGLGSIIPGGRALPSTLDVGTEKRLAQLESDKEKLLDQMRETQRPRRSGLRDWDRLDRESSICALKSELAEGHLQRMADESTGGGIMY